MIEEKVNMCIAILEDIYGVPQAEEIDPVDLLVMTILSQNTSDANSLRAFGSLKSAYANYEEILAAKEEEISEKIRVGGLAKIKARRIRDVLLKIKQDEGAIDLGFLAGMDKDKARDYLMSFSGIGPKTASVVLLFAFGFPVMPVDTHVFRVCRRLGLVPEKTTPEKAQQILEEIVPAGKYLSLHLNLIRHGRLICQARSPQHDECALQSLCDCYLWGTSLK
ncbi:G/T mismatches repair enzyme [uncultured archaeon]|nr:G/T mismatches repair enzyme [uncultured archaeon]